MSSSQEVDSDGEDSEAEMFGISRTRSQDNDSVSAEFERYNALDIDRKTYQSQNLKVRPNSKCPLIRRQFKNDW